MRAAMRAVLDSKQVAVLAPTTVLAFQHWKTFRARFAPFPVRVEMVSRFRSPKEIKEALAATAAGQVDILIGTHRLLSKDVAFRDLGLLIVDEEQRFGVEAKEKLKRLRSTVDALTLSATPIPRTLQMGPRRHPRHVGDRDAAARPSGHPDLDREVLDRRDRLRHPPGAGPRRPGVRGAQPGGVDLLAGRHGAQAGPEALVAVAHGQMPEGELEKNMLAFVEGRANVLVATTLIENGLDIPRANTLIVNRADRFGLAQLYQLRGRVGRSDRPRVRLPAGPAGHGAVRDRPQAPERHPRVLRAGRRLPHRALDLELRGAGNLLGGQQSGHIEAVGLDLYLKLLDQAVVDLKSAAAGPALARTDARRP
jgi:transcription-repair coupling factor (superfamily II helicase)